jgi:hypothetical protein
MAYRIHTGNWMNGTWLTGVCGALVALAVAVGFKGTSVSESQLEQTRAASVARPRLPAYPPAMGGPDVVQPAPLNAAGSRKAIVDNADLYSAVSKITTHSPTIDKLAASEVLMACASFRPKSPREPVELAAAQQLEERCAGIRQNMRRDDALEKAVELRASAEDDPSPLGRLTSLSQRSGVGSARWQSDDLALVSDALVSSDSVLVSEAIRALSSHLNDGSPDSRLRTQALAHAAGSNAREATDERTAFDALLACASLGRCSDDSAVARMNLDSALFGIRERSEIKRLVEQYRLALRRGITASELLAMR